MAESFLEEQLKRIKDMTEQMSRARTFRETHEVRNQSPRDRGTTERRALDAPASAARDATTRLILARSRGPSARLRSPRC